VRPADARNAGGRPAGHLIPPNNPRRLARSIQSLLADAGRRRELGAAARERLLAEYAPDRIVSLQIASYTRAVERRRALGPRIRGV
jgi:glycosyltransferase involved in cell wall biosynthesis